MSRTNWVMTRREFLCQTSAGLASAGAMGFAEPRSGASISAKPGGEVIYRTLGRTGIRVPVVNMGVMNASNPELIPLSYEAGVRLFDTAMGYQGGRNEEMVGGGIEKLGVRDQVVIVTKIPAPRKWGGVLGTAGKDEAKQEFLENAAGCLKRLRTDYIDVLLLHNVSSAEDVRHPGVMEALAELKSEKKTRFIGVSSHSGQEAVLREVASMDFYDVVLAAFNFTMSGDTALLKAIDNAAKKGIGIIAMKTQGGGRLKKTLAPINETAALKWALANENITTAVPGYTNVEHMEEDLSVARNLELTPEERRFLADKNVRAALQFCQQCNRCVAGCPARADVPALMRTHMYAVQYGNFHQARATLQGIDAGLGLAACGSCEICAARCAFTVDIAHCIEDLKAIYA